jgi:CcmD family protein
MRKGMSTWRSWTGGRRHRGNVMEVSGGDAWIVAVNLTIWTGLFVYLLRLDRRLREMEKEP